MTVRFLRGVPCSEADDDEEDDDDASGGGDTVVVSAGAGDTVAGASVAFSRAKGARATDTAVTTPSIAFIIPVAASTASSFPTMGVGGPRETCFASVERQEDLSGGDGEGDDDDVETDNRLAKL